MGFFDRCILTVLRDRKSRDFHELLEEVDFFHNTLRLHLRRLVDQGLVLKEKTSSKRRGRPKFTYSLPPKLHRQASRLLSDPFNEIVTLPFRKLRHLCRFEKGDTARKSRADVRLKTAPKP